VSVLRPQEQGQAHPYSISAVHGLGEQPLHVDGSHMFRPPDVVVLVSESMRLIQNVCRLNSSPMIAAMVSENVL